MKRESLVDVTDVLLFDIRALLEEIVRPGAKQAEIENKPEQVSDINKLTKKKKG